MIRKIKLYLHKNLNNSTFLFFKKIYTIVYSINYIKPFFIGLFTDKKKIFKIENLNFKFPESPIISYGSRFKYYEINERFLINKYLDKNSKILELGGSVGVVSCIANKKLLKKNNHLVIEPNIAVHKYLKFNKKINNLKFKINRSVVIKNKKSIDFYVAKDYVSSSIFKNKDQVKTIVKCYSIDDLKKKYKINFNTIIMDIEGQEYSFIYENDFEGIQNIFIEFHPKVLSYEKLNFCRKKLRKLKFKLIENKRDVEYWRR